MLRFALLGPLLLAEKLLDRERTQLGADDTVAAHRQPDHVEALAAERHVDASARCHIERRPAAFEERMRSGLMKSDLTGLPASMPEVGIHGIRSASSVSRGIVGFVLWRLDAIR